MPNGRRASGNGSGGKKRNGNGKARTATKTKQGLEVPRLFTTPDVHPYDEVEWELRRSQIASYTGKVSFEQDDVEFPATWSQNATNIVAEKYFRGKLGTPAREWSVKQIIDRVVDSIATWGEDQGRFAGEADLEAFRAELKHILVHQKASFNSPVWFNIGVKGRAQQASACQPYDALVSTPDGLVPIGRLVEEGAVGAKVFDAHGLTKVVAVKANGRKSVLRIHTKAGHTLDVTPDHLVWRAGGTKPSGFVGAGALTPGDQLEWHRTESWGDGSIDCREVAEAALAGWLQSDGFVGQYDGTNRSLTIEAMTVTPAEHAWVTKAIDIVFPDVHRHERTVETQDDSLDCRRIRLYGNVLSDFVERWELRARGTDMRVPDRMFEAPLPVVAAYLQSLFQAEGYVSVRERTAKIGLDMISEELVRGAQALLARFGVFARVRFKSDKRADRHGCWCLSIQVAGDRRRFADEIGFVDPKKATKLEASFEIPGLAAKASKRLEIERIEELGEMDVYDIQTESGEYLSGGLRVHNCFILHVDDSMDSIADWYRDEMFIFKGGSGSGVNVSNLRSSYEQLGIGGYSSGPVSFMRGADAAAGTIKSGGATRRAAKMVVFNVDHPDVIQLRDGSPGFVWCKAVEERKARALKQAGFDMSVDSGVDAYSIQYQNANNSVRVTDEFMRAYEEDRTYDLRAVTTGDVIHSYEARDVMKQIAQAAWECADPGMQYHTTTNDWHTAPAAGPITASNPCAEYVHLDNSPCNLASLNLLKFLRDDNTFDTEAFEHAVSIVLLGQAILCVAADYPTDKIGDNARGFRELGLGYANLGALLMALGVPYDSDEGRAWASAVTSLMQGAAYGASARFAEIVGPFPGTDELPGFAHPENREATLRVLRKHAAFSRAIAERPKDADRQLDGRIDMFHNEIAGGGGPVGADDELARVVDRANEVWATTLDLADRHGVENSQVSVLAPTGCLVGGTLVPTERGLVRLTSLGDPSGEKWQDLGVDVMTDDGPREASKFFVNGLSPVVEAKSRRGYTLRGTPEHRIKIVASDGTWTWKRLADLEAGDTVPFAMGGLVGEPNEVPLPPLGDAYWTSDHTTTVPRTTTPDLAEFLGYFMGDGSLHSKGIRLCVASEDFDVVEHLQRLGKSLFGLEAATSEQKGYTEVAFHSVRLTLWWEACGFAKHAPSEDHSGKGYHPHIPDAVLHSNDREVYAAFLRGLFEADGTVTMGYPHWMSTCFDFSYEVQTLLLALGYPTTCKIDTTGWSQNPLAALRLLNQSYNGPWLDEVGFIGSRKMARVKTEAGVGQAARADHIPMTRQTIDRVAPESCRLRRVMLMETKRSGSISRRLAREAYESSGDEELGRLLGFFYDQIESAELGEEELTYDLSVPDNVTYVANGFVSHNTIGFMMDCDTTGVEPDLALKKVKKMVGGGTMQIVNRTIPRALKRLGYNEEQIEAIVDYIDENNTAVGAPALRPEHYPVFACSFTTDNLIHYMGHLRMMAAVQPGLSGGISKTVNAPEEATVEDLEQVFFEGWRLGLKAVAIYRDNCKADQPLSAEAKKAVEEAVDTGHVAGTRKRLPKKRPSMTYSFRIGDTKGYVHVGLYPDTEQPGELFIKTAKQGSTLAGLMDAFGIAVSMGLQHGVPLETFVEKFMNMSFEPHGITDDEDIRFARSLMDFIFRKLAIEFLPLETRSALGIKTTTEREQDLNGQFEKVAESEEEDEQVAPGSQLPEARSSAELVSQPAIDAPLCSNCGIRMRPSGSCFACESCGSTSGCS